MVGRHFLVRWGESWSQFPGKRLPGERGHHRGQGSGGGEEGSAVKSLRGIDLRGRIPATNRPSSVKEAVNIEETGEPSSWE
jgi:hypothetical protein